MASFFGGPVFRMIANTGLVAKAVLLVLLIFSLFSWALILAKWSLYKRARAQSGRFLRAFRKTARLSEIAPVAEQFKPSPLAAVFEGGYEELNTQGGIVRNVTALQRAMHIASSEQLSKMETSLGFLATTGSVTPFIGLFGTVWGIMDAFSGLGNAGAATLRAVAPGISEALITTAVGLLAAVPGVIGYNHFTQSMREFAARMDDFTMEFLNAAEHERDRESAVRQQRAAPIREV